MTTYGMLLFPDAEELDFVGPWEVFTASEMLRAADQAATADTAVLIAQSLDPVRCHKGMRVLPDRSLDDHPDLDVLLVPGGPGTRQAVGNEVLMKWIAGMADRTPWLTSVCTGSLLLVASGAAAGKRVATHWSFEDALERRGDCTVVRDARWVQDGKVVTSQGVSAGIDMALWLVGQLHGVAHARKVQRFIQYSPAPPYAADVAPG